MKSNKADAIKILADYSAGELTLCEGMDSATVELLLALASDAAMLHDFVAGTEDLCDKWHDESDPNNGNDIFNQCAGTLRALASRVKES